MKKDTPIELATIDKLTYDELDKLVNDIRERRLHPVKVYEESLKLKAAAKAVKLENELEHAQNMFKKELERVDRAIEKLQKRATTIRGLRMEIEG